MDLVKGYNEEMEIPIPSAYSTEVINADRNQIPRPETACKWPHLNVISDKLMKYNLHVDIGLLIGLNCTGALKAQEQIADDNDDHPCDKTWMGNYWWDVSTNAEYSGSVQNSSTRSRNKG